MKTKLIVAEVLLLGMLLASTAGATHAQFSSASGNAGSVFAASTCFQPVPVAISNFKFTPAALTVQAGCSIAWTNTVSTKHSSTSTTGIWDSGALSQNDTYTRAFDSAGTFAYKCKFHPAAMQGSITVV